MPARQSTAQIEEQHQHLFRTGYREGEQYCQCGALKVSLEEYQRRISEWNNYFDLVRTTDSYQDFKKMKEIMWTQDNPEKVELLRRVKERLEKDDYLSRPSFPDPTTWNKYVTE
jgi:hypothetical protein